MAGDGFRQASNLVRTQRCSQYGDVRARRAVLPLLGGTGDDLDLHAQGVSHGGDRPFHFGNDPCLDADQDSKHQPATHDDLFHVRHGHRVLAQCGEQFSGDSRTISSGQDDQKGARAAHERSP
jgi:hypothetical protein